MVYTHILVPTDCSPAAHYALEYAMAEATHHQAKLTLLHVVQHHPTPEVYYVKGAPQRGMGYGCYAIVSPGRSSWRAACCQPPTRTLPHSCARCNKP